MARMPETSAPAALPRILSGMQPTSDSLHLGNYLGALVNWVKLQDDFDAYYFVADLHALTVPTDPAVLRQRTRRDGGPVPRRRASTPSAPRCSARATCTEHAELGWVMNCLTGDGEARRMTQFKDKVAKGQNANVGLLTYPMLMAADILMYDAAYVPVGEDQRQHLEITRDLAERFNTRFGETLVVPDAYIVKGSAKIMDLQDPTSKMSKTGSSPKGLIDLMEDPARIAKNIRSAVTDTDGEVRYDPETKPGVSNLLVIHSVLSGTPVEELEASFAGRATATSRRRWPTSSSSASRRSRSGWPSCSTTRPSSTGSSPTARTGPARSPRRRWLGCARPRDCCPVLADRALTRCPTRCPPRAFGRVAVVPTIGVSIAIPSPHAEMLQAKRASFGDPLADSIPTHVTLLPPTEVEGDDLDAVVEHLEARCGAGTFVPDGAARHRHLPAHLAGRLRPGLRRARRLRAAREGRSAAVR